MPLLVYWRLAFEVENNTMTIGWSEALIILVVLIILVGLVFRGGVTRGRGKRRRP